MEKYLLHYAEPELAAIDDLMEALGVQASWENVMVIPACNESPEFLRPPPPCGGRSLMILVINESVVASPRVSENNQALAMAVLDRFDLKWQTGLEFAGFELSLFQDSQFPRDVLMVDRFNDTRKLPVKGGVGLARKIGVDLAASLIHHRRIRSPWIHCTDADVRLPENYFTSSLRKQGARSENAALVYPFHHGDADGANRDTKVLLSTQLYELSLRYYVAGMRFAGSPYAFHTIGSTMAVSAVHYAKVRGFPRRAAGEDFYLLNKLAKVGSVLEIEGGVECKPIEIESRCSDRVPFGTGAAVNKISAMTDPVKEFRFYHPSVFELLRLWLDAWPAIWQNRSSQLKGALFERQDGEINQHKGREVLLEGLKLMKTEKALEHAFRQSSNWEQFSRQMHTWFDAFRTLKLIHYLRDCHQANIGYSALTTNSGYQHLLTCDAELSDFVAVLPFEPNQQVRVTSGS